MSSLFSASQVETVYQLRRHIRSVQIAVDVGVLILRFPFFYDQPRSIDNLVDTGMSISMDLLSLTTDTVLNAVLAIVNDDR